MFQGFVHVGLELVVLPFFIGAITERVASRKWLFANTFPRLWNLSVKLTVAWWAAKYILFVDRVGLCGGNSERSNHNDSHRIESWIEWWIVIDVKKQCTTGLQELFLAMCFLRLLSFCISARLGSVLQPVSITGSIATGKSTVCQMLQNNNPSLTLIDLDIIGHDILVPGKLEPHDCAYGRLVETFGEDILESSKKKKEKIIVDDTEEEEKMDDRPIDRRKLGDVIFQDATKRRMLNQITHPLISKIMMKRIVRYGYFSFVDANRIVCVDCPLLFEIGLKMKTLFGVKIVVACSPALQLERLVERNPDLTREQCQMRILSQIPITEKVHMADVVIWNNGSLEELSEEVHTAYQEVLSRVIGYGFSFTQIMVSVGILFIAATATLHL